MLAGIVLVSATALPAQRFISSGFSSGNWGGYFGGYSGYGGYGDYSYEAGAATLADRAGGFGLHHPAAPAQGLRARRPRFPAKRIYGLRSGCRAGQENPAEQAAPKPSLGDIVRSMHFYRPVNSHLPTPARLCSLQDNDGKLFACRPLRRTAAIPSSPPSFHAATAFPFRWSSAQASRSAPHGLPQLPHVICQILARNGFDIRIHHPGKNCRHPPAQTQKFDLNVNTFVRLQIARIEIQSPEVTAIVSHGAFAFVLFPGVSHLGDAQSPWRSEYSCVGSLCVKANIELRKL